MAGKMQIFRGLEEFKPPSSGPVVSVGFFDGVHLGHREILSRAVGLARKLGTAAVCLTFDPHPDAVVRPEETPPIITTLDMKEQLIAALGVDALVVLTFTEAIAELTREEFINSVLLKGLNAGAVVVGENFVFGRRREGDARFLAESLKQLGIQVEVVPLFSVRGKAVSSTRIRTLLGSGDVEGARALLGRYPTVRGKVVSGFGRGGPALGFPTANIEVENLGAVPGVGVYAAIARVAGAEWPAVVNLGRTPTFGALPRVEMHVHIMGFKDRIYGEMVDVEICKRLRNEKAFASETELAEQIGQDVKRAGVVLRRSQL